MRLRVRSPQHAPCVPDRVISQCAPQGRRVGRPDAGVRMDTRGTAGRGRKPEAHDEGAETSRRGKNRYCSNGRQTTGVHVTPASLQNEINSESTEDLSAKAQTVGLLEEPLDGKSSRPQTWQRFLGLTPKLQAAKER